MNQIGGTSQTGVNRLALSYEDRRARDLFVSLLIKLNLKSNN